MPAPSSIQSVIVMPCTEAEEAEALADQLRAALGIDKIAKYASDLDTLRDVADGKVDLKGVTDQNLAAAAADVLAPVDPEEVRQEKLATWGPVELLVPEWRYLQKPALFPEQQNSRGLMVTRCNGGRISIHASLESLQ
ncbi:hypothetical protein HP499_05100 [Paenarthrobacter sp. CM16]|uniref:hypothetical protein n=1 Tax=Paenarthrobacter sp. CM16 TaxID=2738447 RepID=UPI0015566B76|nr:hypothetical protein [Paenarthrobacter sp. CM16]NQD87185.1 hypothetical protein [Paenarthrobacter sp. CM16]